jgi:vitamin B12 transporter
MHHPIHPFRGSGTGLTVLSLLTATSAMHAADRLDPIIVTTPMRIAQTVDQTLHPVSVITRADIERLQPADVPQLLRGLPGVQVASSGGRGKQASVFLRGANSNQIVVLIDGVRAGSATAGGAAWEYLPLEQIDRIEVVRGPRASAYGADAVGGVIQIFTRGPEAEPVREVSAGYGRFNTREASGTLSARHEAFRYQLGISHSASDGYDVRRDGDPDDDGYRNDAINLGLGHRFDNGVDLEWRLTRAEGDTEFDNAFGAPGESREDFVQQASSLHLSGPAGDASTWRLTAGESRDERDTIDAGFAYRFDTQRRNFAAQVEWLVKHWQITIGTDYLEDRVSSSTEYTRTSRDTRAGFVQLQTDWGDHRVGAGLRHDRYSDFGSHGTGDLAWSYRIDDTWGLRASYGTAFRAPTFNELFFPADPFFGGGGNPDLSPERSRNLEAGLSLASGSHELAVNAFDNRIRDLIVLDSNFVPQNASRARITGWEAGWSWSETEWRVAASYTWLHTRDEETDNRLPRRARHSGRVDLDRDLGRLTLGTSLIGQGRRYDDQANTVPLPGYATLDLRAAYQIHPRWRASAAWSNVLDRDYETVAGYPQPGQALQVEIRGRF